MSVHENIPEKKRIKIKENRFLHLEWNVEVRQGYCDTEGRKAAETHGVIGGE